MCAQRLSDIVKINTETKLKTVCLDTISISGKLVFIRTLERSVEEQSIKIFGTDQYFLCN